MSINFNRIKKISNFHSFLNNATHFHIVPFISKRCNTYCLDSILVEYPFVAIYFSLLKSSIVNPRSSIIPSHRAVTEGNWNNQQGSTSFGGTTLDQDSFISPINNSRIAIVAFLSSGSFELPHLGEYIHPGQPS